MGYNRENFKRIRAEYETKALRAEEEAQARRQELYAAVPSLRELDARLSATGLQMMQVVMKQEDVAAGVQRLREENQRIMGERAALLRKNGFPEDYTEPQYECDRCRDTGYVGVKMCDCMRRRLMEAGMESSGLSALLRKQTFENFSLDFYRSDPAVYRRMSENYRNVYSYAHNFSIEPGKPMPSSLFFIGKTGLGKTHLSTAVAGVVISRGYDVFYNSAVGMLSDFESRRFGDGLVSGGSGDTARYIDCDLLMIDDLGTEVVNQFTLSCLYYVLNTRLNLQKPMIISTNLRSGELERNYGDRIASRLMGEFQLIPFLGEDVRKQKAER